jgi:hypothetical protein
VKDDVDGDGWDIDPDELEEILRERATASRRARNRDKHVGMPLNFMSDVCRLTEGRAALIVALLLYRRTHVNGSRTVTLPTADLIGVGIDRSRKREAPIRLQRAGLIGVRNSKGQSAAITLKWRG